MEKCYILLLTENSEKTMLATYRQIFKAHINANANIIESFLKMTAILECNSFFYTQCVSHTYGSNK